MGTGIRLTPSIINLFDRSSNNRQKQKVTKSCFSTSLCARSAANTLSSSTLLFMFQIYTQNEKWKWELNGRNHLPVQVGGGGLCVRRPSVPISFSFRQLSAKILQSDRLAHPPPGNLVPPLVCTLPPGNPRSTTAVSRTLTLVVWLPSVWSDGSHLLHLLDRVFV